MADARFLGPPDRRVVLRGAAAGLGLAVLPGAAGAQLKPTPSTIATGPQPIEIIARPIDHFEKASPSRRRFGRLEWRGGLALTSPAQDFGGWSGLTIDPDGERLLAVSDAGSWMTASLVYEGTRPKGLANARIGPLRGLGGAPLNRGRDRDAECVTLLDGTLASGTLLIGFERNHRIGRFGIDARGVSAPLSYLKLPPEARRMRPNRGFEAVAVVRSGPLAGAIVAFSEHFIDDQGHHTGWIWQRGEPQRLALVDSDDFDVTDAAGLPDGSLIVLERRFRWTEGVKMRLRLVQGADLRPEAVLQGETLLTADLAYDIDNMEGLAVHRGIRGETILTLISDNNFNGFWQRTVLLQFVLATDDLAGVAIRR